jgi:hypothetical protein
MVALLESVAYEVTPRIAYPHTPAETVQHLAELALDCPALLTEPPVYIAISPDGQHALLPNVPLKGLYVNALDRAIRFGLDEVERLIGAGAVLSEQARTLLWAMERAYVEQGRDGGFWMRGVLQHLGLVGWEAEAQAREGVLLELTQMGLIEQRSSRAEIYDLATRVKVPLVRKHRLFEKWDEHRRDTEAIALAQAASQPARGGDR